MIGRYERRLAARGAARRRCAWDLWTVRKLGVVVGRCSAAVYCPRLVSRTSRCGTYHAHFFFLSFYLRFRFDVEQRTKVKLQKGQYERMARMPRNQLLGALFALFREREQWSIKLLREKTQQPEVYLKEVLSEIATLHRSGEFNGTWELMPSFKGDGGSGFLCYVVRAHFCVYL